MCISSKAPDPPPPPAPLKEPTLLADDELRRRGTAVNSRIKTNPMGVAASPMMSPGIIAGG